LLFSESQKYGIPPTTTVHRVCAIVLAIVKFRDLMLMEIKICCDPNEHFSRYTCRHYYAIV